MHQAFCIPWQLDFLAFRLLQTKSWIYTNHLLYPCSRAIGAKLKDMKLGSLPEEQADGHAAPELCHDEEQGVGPVGTNLNPATVA
jgi:hypothetical protein